MHADMFVMPPSIFLQGLPSLCCSLLFCAADIQGYDRRCLGTVVAISHAICYEFPRVGKYIRRIVFFAKYLKRADVLAFVQLMEGALSVTELVLVDTDLGFFKSSLQLLLSSMKILSTLTFKGCSISTQTLNVIVEGVKIIHNVPDIVFNSFLWNTGLVRSGYGNNRYL